MAAAFTAIHTISGSEDVTLTNTEIGSVIYANKLVMAVLVNRQPAVSASSAALPTSLVNMRPNGIAATSSTGDAALSFER